MKILITAIRIIVGLLFIFSGLIKANDPLGLAYKMQEYFDLWNLGALDPHSLWLSVVMIAFEIIAGAALLLGWQMRLFSWLLLLLILFFTLLTGYAYFSGKFTNCGCFGDCIPITAKTSFLKDIALTLMILFLFANRKRILPVFSNKATIATMLAVTLFSFGIQWYVLNYLPIKDCLPFKINNSIPDKMKIPEGAVPDSFAIMFVYEKGGKEYDFAPAELPADLNTYTFVKRKDKLVRKGNAEPPIKGFLLSGITDEDSTMRVLAQPYAVLLFCENFSVPVSKWQNDFAKLYTEAKAKNIPAYVITTQLDEARNKFAATPFKDVDIFKCDFTAIRTAARTNPCVYLIENGKIIDKQSYRRMNKITDQLKSIAVQPAANDQ
jgi:uncharacterized membrane protein YphA (DoxX/SURF4 family)